MSVQLWETINVGYVTYVLENEINQACLGCANKLTRGQKIFIMHKENGTTIMCSNQTCFEKQGGYIDEYQTNTIITRKGTTRKGTTTNDKPTSIHSPDADFEDRVMIEFYRIDKIQNILLENVGKKFDGNPAKLGMYMKMIDDGMQKNKNHT